VPVAAGTSLFFDYQHIWWDSGTMTISDGSARATSCGWG
jgi:hypothetical protein